MVVPVPWAVVPAFACLDILRWLPDIFSIDFLSILGLPFCVGNTDTDACMRYIAQDLLCDGGRLRP